MSKVRLATPSTAYAARPQGHLRHRPHGRHPRPSPHDHIHQNGCVTLRLGGRLHHIGIGRTHTAAHVLLLVQDLHVHVIDAATGELLRELTVDPTRDYQHRADRSVLSRRLENTVTWSQRPPERPRANRHPQVRYSRPRGTNPEDHPGHHDREGSGSTGGQRLPLQQ
jgi:hypothetical protein